MRQAGWTPQWRLDDHQGMAETTDPAADDISVVLAVVREFDAAVDGGDFEVAGRLCMDDFLFYGSGEGEESLGPEGLGDMLIALRARVGPDLLSWDLAMDPYEVTVVGDCARVTARGRFKLVMRESTRSGRYLMLGVLRRTREGWRWWAYHGSEPQPW
jgi:ketosteroid isomerase-like protein